MNCRFCGKAEVEEGTLCQDCKIKKAETVQRISKIFDEHKKEENDVKDVKDEH